MYADNYTDSMRKAIGETTRRRKKQMEYNEANGIDPQTVRKRISDILEMLRGKDGGDDSGRSGGRGRGRGGGSRRVTTSTLDLPRDELGRLILSLTDEMHDASRDLRFEEAARLRDEIHDLKRELRDSARHAVPLGYADDFSLITRRRPGRWRCAGRCGVLWASTEHKAVRRPHSADSARRDSAQDRPNSVPRLVHPSSYPPQEHCGAGVLARAMPTLRLIDAVL